MLFAFVAVCLLLVTVGAEGTTSQENVPHVRKVNNILMGFRNEAQRNLISNLPPHTKVGCDSFYKGTVMTVACLYEKRLD
ncbi:hypothetical protein COOONC_24348 [Cooperia oncophora]